LSFKSSRCEGGCKHNIIRIIKITPNWLLRILIDSSTYRKILIVKMTLSIKRHCYFSRDQIKLLVRQVPLVIRFSMDPPFCSYITNCIFFVLTRTKCVHIISIIFAFQEKNSIQNFLHIYNPHTNNSQNFNIIVTYGPIQQLSINSSSILPITPILTTKTNFERHTFQSYLIL